MDVYNDGKRMVGSDRAISQNPDRFRAKRTLDVDLARRDVGQVWCRNGAQQCERIDAASRFPRSTTPVATARVHRVIRGRQVRLCSWLAAGSGGGGAKPYGSNCFIATPETRDFSTRVFRSAPARILG